MDALTRYGRNHVRKYLEAVVYGDQLAGFWGDYSAMASPCDDESWELAIRRRQEAAEAAAGEANLAKQRGFYVDRDGGIVFSPTSEGPGTTAEDLQTAAQVVEMLLIRDHSRMKLEEVTPYDSTHDRQFRLLPISHPEDWLAASEDFRSGDPDETAEPELRLAGRSSP